MRLTNIKAVGFKSFADKIDIAINSNITAIVGPNGSGKSNIVDAVRWVLGEQSVKSLRGSSTMTDCIFAGSKTREALKRAEVALSFNNEDHHLNSEMTEIEIKRVVYHTGENEYFLNNTKVRLKDITNLFLDSGVGIDSFNIISQGSIESVVNSKPEERRVIFEEAAGVLKYKKHKIESLRKLEKTKDNLDKIAFVIDELEISVLPLEQQSIVAKKYLEYKQKLEELEIAFIASDIKSKNEEYTKIKQEVEWLEKSIYEFTNNQADETNKLESLRLKNIKLEEQISESNGEILKRTEEIASKNSEKEITLERLKYSVDKERVSENLIALKEQELALKNKFELAKVEVASTEKFLKNIEKEIQEHAGNFAIETIKESQLVTKINELKRSIWDSKNKIEILENNIENDVKLPVSVKNIINHTRMTGIHGTIGKLLTIPEDKIDAIDIGLGFSSNFIVVENESVAKTAIQYLKENHLGRATFFPMNIIKGKRIDVETKRIIEQEKGFIGVASDLVKYNELYQNIIENQLGNIIVVDNIDNMNIIGKKIQYRYRIVSLTGDILHTGGSLTGGSMKKGNSSLNDSVLLEKEKTKLKETEFRLDKYIEERSKLETTIKDFLETEQMLSRQKILLEEASNRQNEEVTLLKKATDDLKKEQVGNENILHNTLDNQLLKILEDLNEFEKQSILLKKENNDLKTQKSEISSSIACCELEYREKNTEQNKIEQECKKKEIMLGKLNVQLDTLLITLSENYNLTFEKARMEYPLDVEFHVAKETVEHLKKEMQSLGNVNLGSIEEFERLNTRYTFLKNQKEDLQQSSETLLDIIKEMDEIMKTRFQKSFETISLEFSSVFKKLFKGGNGVLKLTNPKDLLETGIDIIAEPPGKRLNNIALLSGGEKTLTAMALLFAILNVKPVPFCILDEIEASLDEANVDTFGSYLQSQKEKSEFILITHKKRTMEYADTLYGITMQESGVSKIVSVELENI